MDVIKNAEMCGARSLHHTTLKKAIELSPLRRIRSGRAVLRKLPERCLWTFSPFDAAGAKRTF